MGSLTTNLAIINKADGNPTAQINTRAPRGITKEQIDGSISKRMNTINSKNGTALSLSKSTLIPYHFVPTEGRLVDTLLRVWEEVTGEPGYSVAIGGGTQARLFPDGVDFGMAYDKEIYRGHVTDEFMTREELNRAAELTITAILRLTTGEWIR